MKKSTNLNSTRTDGMYTHGRAEEQGQSVLLGRSVLPRWLNAVRGGASVAAEKKAGGKKKKGAKAAAAEAKVVKKEAKPAAPVEEEEEEEAGGDAMEQER